MTFTKDHSVGCSEGPLPGTDVSYIHVVGRAWGALESPDSGTNPILESYTLMTEAVPKAIPQELQVECQGTLTFRS